MSGNKTWIDVQKKTFTNWANNYLKERILKIGDLSKDLEDGILLINLLEVISSKKIPGFSKAPKVKFQKIENNNLALRFIQNEGLKLVAIGAEDIVDGNLKLILGLIWTIILRYQIQNIMGDTHGETPKAALLDWVKKRVAPYGVEVRDFSNSWLDGRALSALTDSLEPGVLPFESISRDPFASTDRAMDVAQDSFDIPKIMDPSDMVSIPDELSVMTYISYFRDYANENDKRRSELEAAENARRLKTAYAHTSTASGPGLSAAVVGEPGMITIQSRNYFGDPISTGGDNFVLEVVSQDGHAAEAFVKDNNNGTYSAHYIATRPVPHTVKISLKGEPIKDSPWTSTVSGADASQTNAYGPGLEGGQKGKPAPFKIQARTKNGAPHPYGGDPFVVNVKNDKTGQTAPARVKDNGDGTYDVDYTPSEGGNFHVDVTLDGQPISGGPFSVTIMDATPDQSYAKGPGLEGGQQNNPATFTIFAIDGEGRPVTKGGEPFSVNVHGPEGETPVHVEDNGDGTYSVAYSPSAHGDYTVNVTLHGRPIKDTPKKVHIKPAPDATQSYAEGPGLEGGQAEKPAKFTIHAKDFDGNDRKDGGDPFEVNVEGPAPAEVKVKDNGDGTYDVEYYPTVPGDYKVNVTLNDEAIKDTPKTVHIKPHPDAGHSYAEGPGLEGGQALQPSRFKIFARDREDKPRADGGDPFTVKVQGPVDTPATVKDNGDGTYDVEYHPTVPGDYVVTALLGSDPIKNTPVSVSVKAAPSANLSYAAGPGLEKVFDNEPARFTIYSVDVDGKPRTDGGDPFDVVIKGPQDVKAEVVDNNDGTYGVTWAPEHTGDYTVEVTLRGEHIKNSPHQVNVREGTDASQSGFGSFTFTLQARDKKGANKTFGGDKFEVAIAGPAENIQVQARDNQDGSYTGAYSLLGSGRFVIDVKLNGKNVEGSPFKQNVGSTKGGKDLPQHTSQASVN
eukprot:TRINITY_DN222_c0_g1_i3.p1 TRINITY_DN222_c0_g1~~TRINITY_DN222_c0_g1_i3.p1  ORF type:complete len:958 (+),score=357.35 TRINITY_DN222_c0_g1_i3:135-3008(+)